MQNATRGKTLQKEVYTREEIHRLLACFSRKCPTGIRNRALIVIGYRCGLRLGEALALRPSDLDLERGIVHVRLGKGRKERRLGVDPTAIEFLSLWASERASLPVSKNSPFFCTLDGGEIEQAYVRGLLKRKGLEAGIEKRLHFHGLRHSYACGLVEDGIDPVRIQKSLGHKSLLVTSVYLDHVAPQALVDLAKTREW